MTALLGRVALAALGIAFAESAVARELRFPANRTPAFVLQIPDDWKEEIDEDGNMIVVSADRSTSFVMTFGSFSRALDDAIKIMLQVAKATPATGKAPASISGLSGFSYNSTMKTAHDRPLTLKLVIVRIGEKGFASCTKIEAETNSPEQRKLADTVMQSVRLVAAGIPGRIP